MRQEVRGQAGEGLLFQPSWTLSGRMENHLTATVSNKGIGGEPERTFLGINSWAMTKPYYLPEPQFSPCKIEGHRTYLIGCSELPDAHGD